MTTTTTTNQGDGPLPISIEPVVEVSGRSRELKDIRKTAMNIADSSPDARERSLAHTVLALTPYVERAETCEARIAAKPRRTPRKKAK